MTGDFTPLNLRLIVVWFTTLMTNANAGEDNITDADAVENMFFVVFKRDRTRVGTMSIGSTLHGANIQRKHKIFDIEAVSVQVPGADTLVNLRSDPNVDYVEPVLPVFLFSVQTKEKGNCVQQEGAPWNLDRIDQLNGTDGIYHYNEQNGGSQTFVYVLDTEVLISHPEFEGRAVLGDFLCSSCKERPGGGLHGHGTHVAGIIGGKTYGVAKKVNIVSVQVIGNNGIGNAGDAVEALQWVIGDCEKRAKIGACVVNLSFGTVLEIPSKFLNQAVDRLVDGHIPVVAAAGNERQDACNVSPGSAAKTITVASIDRKDRRSIFSNFGSCVDIFAPGEDIVSAWVPNGTVSIRGTSQAAPHVTGILALYLTSLAMTEPGFQPGDHVNLMDFLNASSVLGIVRYADGGTNRVPLISCKISSSTTPSPASTTPATYSMLTSFPVFYNPYLIMAIVFILLMVIVIILLIALILKFKKEGNVQSLESKVDINSETGSSVINADASP